MELLRLFVSFTKVGIFAYGGGPSMIPLIQEEVVDRNAWMTIE
ncbi:MAG: chromate transporter, partial [Gemmatimonadota bacterium]|nr:chromate transporter [Gemmatimonadota bacterium]